MRECNAQNMWLRLMASIDRMGEFVCFKFTPLVFFNKICRLYDIYTIGNMQNVLMTINTLSEWRLPLLIKIL